MNLLSTAGAACCLAVCAGLPAAAQVSVLTYHNDTARTGQNLNETILTTANVSTNTFGKLFSAAVDGMVYAQPLYVPGLTLPGQGTHDVVFIATEHNSVYAFDANDNAGATGGLLWHTNLGPSAAVPNADFGNRYGPFADILPEIGITCTPVVDPVSGTLYVDAFTHEGNAYYHRLHALNILDGTEQPFSPVLVTASVPGTGVDSSGGLVSFNAVQQLQRSAMTLAGGKVYIAFAGYADTDPYHGWVIGFDAATLEQVTNYVFNDTPNSTVAAFGDNAGEGGIWMAGNGVAVDADTNLFFTTGNGSFNATHGAGETEYGDSFIKLSTANGLALTDYFTPYNQANLALTDLDVGSGGVVLLPDSVGTASHPHLLIGCGKEGTIYLIDRDNLGHYRNANDNQIVQELPTVIGGAWSSPAYFNSRVYFGGSGDSGFFGNLTVFQITNGLLSISPSSESPTPYGFPGATPAISANGTNDAIVWALQTDGYTGNPGILHAYDAYDLSQELYNSDQAGPRDVPGLAVKFTVPTIANGKVYVGCGDSFAVFGLLDPHLNWQRAHFGDDATNAAIAGDLADPDGDGVPNLMEYALGSNPNAADAANQVTGTIVADQFQVQFHRNPAAKNLTFVLQVSSNLTMSWTDLMTYTDSGGWTADWLGATQSESVPAGVFPDYPVTVTITDPTAVGTSTCRYYRLAVHP